MIYTANGIRINSFCWGLGHKTNNHAEILALFKAFQLAQGKGIKDVQVFGDSEILIKTLNTNALFNDPLLNKSLQRLRLVMHDFSSHLLFHILCGSNKEADVKANEGYLLSQGAPRINEEEAHWAPIP